MDTLFSGDAAVECKCMYDCILMEHFNVNHDSHSYENVHTEMYQ